MKQLPEAYQRYLDGLGSAHAEALRPVFLESVAEQEHGVLVRGAGTRYVQALVDERVPYGEVREED
ncbi:hypothetical protein HER39_10410 [Arthrobacter deserti]|uniref:Uncharacterized protein n=1 Tax=Arthrobacter deserti TaxID=1742687 RepID=A0ABX1JRN6_9MICC|nr:hypothetical protein [Arthrobacter deserti]